MTTTMLPDLTTALPEILLAVGAMALLMLGVFRGNKSTSLVSWLAVLLMLAALVVTVGESGGRTLAFANMFVADGFTTFMKVLVLIASALAVVMSLQYFRELDEERFEIPVLMVLSTLGMMVMVSANDLISLYMGLELQSLSLYVLASVRRDSERATEAGLKYFVLGALSSGILLYGSSMVYGFVGSTNFTTIAEALSHSGEHGASVGAIIGLVFVLSGLAFKISAVPFHMWTPDVYEGAPTPITSFFAVAPKVAALALLTRVLFVPFAEMSGSWHQILVFMAIASMVLGSAAAIAQTNIKRLMAYSSIGHIGFALVGLAAGTEQGISGLIIYMTIYLVMNVGTFGIILSMRRKDGIVEEIDDLSGLARTRPGMAATLAIFMFSLAGIPPLAGFFGKFYVFAAAIKADLYLLAVIGVLASVVGAFYYLRIVKVMYFDKPVEAFLPQKSREMKLITVVAAVLIVAFILPQVSMPVLESAQEAARALLF
ncbi:NADH-quinone oxidoreductase subunit NuoN [Emcibacter sp.]|uniref:NADH-quinone oxidoreductase subunit NuoN n=1 Tax=Emcibacter sp. TaxID=1979954 RepID=UPI002AA87371|nr:NADH-quinone oxidoreductase subunit NuoN [Emcibacter sp.]